MSVNVQFSIIFMKHGFLALKCQHTGLDIKAGLKENKMGLFYKPVQRTFMFRVQPGVKCSQISERWNLNCMQKATMLYIFYFELQKGDLQKVQRLCSCVVQCIMHEDYPPPPPTHQRSLELYRSQMQQKCDAHMHGMAVFTSFSGETGFDSSGVQ